jgi:hypothetical protein
MPCARCGDYRCDECFDFDPDVTVCSSCVPARILWVKEQKPSTLWQTFALVVTQGPRLFSTAVGTGERQHAHSFAVYVAIAAVSPLVALLLLGTLAAGGRSGGIAGAMGAACGGLFCSMPSVAFGQLVRGGLYGFVYDKVDRLLGGTASASSSYDASYYSMALTPFYLVAYVFLLNPLLGPLLTLAGLLMNLGWGIHLVAHHAHARHELSWPRAYVAAASPIILVVGLYAAIVVFAVLRAFA